MSNILSIRIGIILVLFFDFFYAMYICNTMSLFFNYTIIMVTKSTFHGKFMYYENINGKEKKLSKEFTDSKKFNDFTKKYPLPTLASIF